jgi:hypothetical protein
VVQTANLVLDQEKAVAPFGIDDLPESVLMVAHVFGNQTTCLEKTIAPGKLCHVNRDVMAIIRAQRLGRLAKDQRLGTADAYFSNRAGAIRLQRRRRAEHGLVKPYGLTAAAPLHMLRRLEPSEAYPPCLLSRSCRVGREGRAPRLRRVPVAFIHAFTPAAFWEGE